MSLTSIVTPPLTGVSPSTLARSKPKLVIVVRSPPTCRPPALLLCSLAQDGSRQPSPKQTPLTHPTAPASQPPTQYESLRLFLSALLGARNRLLEEAHTARIRGGEPGEGLGRLAVWMAHGEGRAAAPVPLGSASVVRRSVLLVAGLRAAQARRTRMVARQAGR